MIINHFLIDGLIEENELEYLKTNYLPNKGRVAIDGSNNHSLKQLWPDSQSAPSTSGEVFVFKDDEDPISFVVGKIAAAARLNWSIATTRYYEYSEGGYIDWHTDGSGKILSAVLYFNAVMAGGELELREIDGTLTTIAPSAGRVVVIPPTLRHRTLPVIDGTRRSLAIFYLS